MERRLSAPALCALSACSRSMQRVAKEEHEPESPRSPGWFTPWGEKKNPGAGLPLLILTNHSSSSTMTN